MEYRVLRLSTKNDKGLGILNKMLEGGWLINGYIPTHNEMGTLMHTDYVLFREVIEKEQ